MEMHSSSRMSELFARLARFMRLCIFRVLSVGPIPSHISFIMDGNRRFAKKKNLETGAGHRTGFTVLLAMLKYCYELGVKYVSVYAFSIDNFKRRPDEVQMLMDLMLEKIEGLLKEESIVHKYGIRVYFIGNLKLLSDPVRDSAEKVMRITSKNTKCVLLICVAFSSSDEMTHAAQESCKHKIKHVECNGEYRSIIKTDDVEKHMDMAVAPDPDILIRTGGETRLSNFLLWQTSNCMLYAPDALWPEIGVRHLVWTVLKFQRNHAYYLENKKKQLEKKKQ